MTGILPIATAAPAIEIQDINTGIIVTFDDCFALSAAIIETIRALSPEERAETIADMVFFTTFARTTPDQSKALNAFWTTVRDLFTIEAEHPDAEQGDEAWHEAQHLERRAAMHLMSAGIRDIHLPGCATFALH